MADSWFVTARGKESAIKPIRKTTLSLTLFLLALGRISSLIKYHATTISRNRVKDSLAIMIHYTIFQFLFRFFIAFDDYTECSSCKMLVQKN